MEREWWKVDFESSTCSTRLKSGTNKVFALALTHEHIEQQPGFLFPVWIVYLFAFAFTSCATLFRYFVVPPSSLEAFGWIRFHSRDIKAKELTENLLFPPRNSHHVFARVSSRPVGSGVRRNVRFISSGNHISSNMTFIWISPSTPIFVQSLFPVLVALHDDFTFLLPGFSSLGW